MDTPDKLQALREEIHGLRATLADIAAELPLSELLPTIIGRAARALGASEGEISLVDQVGGELVLYATHNRPASEIGRRRRVGEGLIGRAAASGEPLISPDSAAQAASPPDQDGHPTALAVPLLAGGRLMGVVSVARPADAGPYTADDARRLELYAEQAAIAIKNAHLIETAHRRADEAETLRRVGAVVASTLRQDEAITRILEQLELVVPYDSASVQLLREEGSEIVGGHGFKDRDAVVGLYLPVPGDNPTSLVYERRAPVRLDDVRAAYAIFHHPPHDHIRSWLGAPLIFQGRAFGMIAVDSTEPARFSAEDERTVAAFADQAAIAMENARLFAETRRLAITDPLLGIFNRRHFFELTQLELERSRRYHHALAIVMLDVDGFKQINDTYGHLVGDQVLRGVAGRCRAALRAVDVLGRYGGEELVMLLPETSAAGAADAAERLRQAIAQTPIVAEAHAIHVTASFGVASRDASQITRLEQLLDRADRALYEAKRSGRNRIISL